MPPLPWGNPALFPTIFIPDGYEGPRLGYPWIEFGRMTLTRRTAAWTNQTEDFRSEGTAALTGGAGRRAAAPRRPEPAVSAAPEQDRAGSQTESPEPQQAGRARLVVP